MILDVLSDGPQSDANRQTSQSAQTYRQTRRRRKSDRAPVEPDEIGLQMDPTLHQPRDRQATRRGLGTYPEISIAEAREKALTMRKLIVRVKTPSTSAIEIEKQLAWPPQPSPSRKPPAKSTTN